MTCCSLGINTRHEDGLFRTCACLHRVFSVRKVLEFPYGIIIKTFHLRLEEIYLSAYVFLSWTTLKVKFTLEQAVKVQRGVEV